MSDVSANDHLEGILSDFEELKRSFDTEDLQDTLSFPLTSTNKSPYSHCTSSGRIMEGNTQGTHSFPSSQPHISMQSKGIKNTIASSLFYNCDTTAKTKDGAASGICRISSFQNKFNPYSSSSSSGVGSDNDSLHSSSSSLDFQASTRMSSSVSSSTGVNEFKSQDRPALMKFSSHGNMFHPDFKATIESESINANHGSMPTLDQNISDIQSVAPPGGRCNNPGFPYYLAPEWQKSSNFGKDLFSPSQQSPKPKDFTKISNFPLDLDNLDIMSQEPPAEMSPMPRSVSRCNYKKGSQPGLAMSSSLLKKDSVGLQSVQDQTRKNHHNFPSGYYPVSAVTRNFSVPLSSPHIKLASQKQVVEVNPVSALPATQDKTTFEPKQETAEKDSVGSVHQRIASFSSADRSRPSENQCNSRSPQLQSSLRYARRGTDTPQGLELQVQMEESEAEKTEEIPCTSKSGPEEHARDHGFFGYVGIEAVLDQMRHKAMKTGFEFNIMVVGQSGLGKSTLMNTLFKSKVSRKSCTPDYEEKIHKTVHLQSVSHVIEERGVKMKLTIIDTPGFGDQINNENCWDPIEKYVNEQYEKYLKEELSINRKRRIPDTRIHCCVYFLPPSGHWLRPIDVEFMKRLGKIMNIVPVIAKADTLTIEERLEFRDRIQRDLEANEISVYPQKEYEEDVEDRILNDKIREKIPFAVVGTDKEHQVNGNKVLGRKTKWGIIEVENVAHCEFANLRDLLIRSHLQDLKDITHNIHYETYRVRRLNDIKVNGIGLSPLMPANSGTENDAENHV
ncbi:uncharacterized protein LOC108927080 isoform X1 [Arapaima gigas]